MNKNYIVLAVVILAAGVLYKRSMEGMDKGKEKEGSYRHVPTDARQASSSSASAPEEAADMITLISSDKKSFQISNKAAEQSEVIRAALRSDSLEAKSKVIVLNNIPADFLSPLADLLNALPGTLNLDNLIIEKFAQYDTPELVTFAYMAQYLEIADIEQSIIRLLIFKELKKKPEAKITALRVKIIKAVMDQNTPGYSHRLGKLLNENFDFIKSSAGFKALGVKITDYGKLDLYNLNISNVYGLSLIKNKDAIKVLWLDHNQLTSLPDRAFMGLTNLERLTLDGNQLSSLTIGTFSELTNLKNLDLANNRLKALPEGMFAELQELRELSLACNQFQTFPAKIFTGRSNLQILNLHDCQLTFLPTDVFAGLANLKILMLSSNRLTALHVGVFAGLSHLKILKLSTNPNLAHLQAGVFAELTQLQILDLQSTYALPGTAAAIKAQYFPADSAVKVYK